jgi:hypothetical protein
MLPYSKMFTVYVLGTVLDLAKLKKGDSVCLKKIASPKLVERYSYNIIIVGDAQISKN